MQMNANTKKKFTAARPRKDFRCEKPNEKADAAEKDIMPSNYSTLIKMAYRGSMLRNPI
jgi:hypothetical protein